MSAPVESLDLGRLLRALEAHEVTFVVVGGLAAIAHGARRMTLDLDIVPSPDAANFRRLADLVAEIGPADGTVVDGELQQLDPRDEVDLARSRNVTLRTSAGRLDVLNRARDAPPFEDLVARSVRVPIAGVDVQVAGLDDLVAMKLATASEGPSGCRGRDGARGRGVPAAACVVSGPRQPCGRRPSSSSSR